MVAADNIPKIWLPPKAQSEPGHRFCSQLGISPLLARLLFQRDLRDSDAAGAYLRPPLKRLHDPDLLPNMDAATDRLCEAIKSKEQILLFGDYDVDGITGSAVLQRVLRALGAEVESYIPDRFTDGYGVGISALERIRSNGLEPKVVITIDNGVVAFDPAQYLADEGIDLIIADHHRMEAHRLPKAHAVIHPKISGSRYPNKNLCGAGVAFKLAWATARRQHGGGKVPKHLQDLLLESMSLVAMGTVADVMPLTGENRTFVKHGLLALESGPTPGLKALLEKSGVKGPLNSASISFRLAPRINAAGRLGAGRRALDLLVAEDEDESERLAEVLDKENDARREIEKVITEAALTQVVTLYGDEPRSAGLVVADEGWHEGVVGIVASRVVDQFRRPSIVLAVLEDGLSAKGSGRSAMGVDLKSALDECKHLLNRYGGHEMAVGLSLPTENIEEFRHAFATAVARQKGILKGEEMDIPPAKLQLDAEVQFHEISEAFIQELTYMEPFGYGNPRPVLGATVELAGAPRLIGKGSQHLSFFVKQGGRSFRAVMWSGAPYFDDLIELDRMRSRPDRSFRIAFKPQFNDFRGQRKIELTITDILLPDRSSSEEGLT
jgi:single-stranded-DNA-specific exonuclease